MRRSLLIGAGLCACLVGGAVALAQGGEHLARLNLEETQLSADQAANMSRLARLLSVLAEFRRDPPPALLVSPSEAKDAVRAAILVKAMTPELQARAEAYAREAGEMMRQRRLAAVQSEALFMSESRQADAAPEPGEDAPLLGQSEPDGPMTPPQALLRPTTAPLTRRFGEPAPGGGVSNGLSFAAPRNGEVISPSAAVCNM